MKLFCLFIIVLGQLACSTKPQVKIKLLGSELIKNSKAKDWRRLDNNNTLYMELKTGRVTIELAPDFAPLHVKNIKQLAANKYWDGLVIFRSQDNYVVQWGFPEENELVKMKSKLKGVKNSLPSEFSSDYNVALPFAKLRDPDTYAEEVGFAKGFPVARSKKENKSWQIHCYGAVGVSRDTDINSGSGKSLYVVTGHSPRHLDRNITIVGRVVEGMEHLTTLPRGHGALGFYKDKKKNVPIKSIRLASDVTVKKQSHLEIMRTNTKLFKRYVASRRNRFEEWFHRPTGKLEICNVPRITRSVK